MNKDITRKSYNYIAKEYYDTYKNDTTDFKYIDKFLTKCKSKILDLGCGMGHYSQYIYNKGFEVSGVDFSKEMLALASQNKNIKFIEADICNLPNNLDKNFDGILIAYVIQHLSKEETKEMLLDLHNYIDKNCNLILFFPEGEGVIKEEEPFNTNFIYDIKRYTIEEITILLSECGYKVIEYEKKPPKNDIYSLCPTTIVLYAQNNM